MYLAFSQHLGTWSLLGHNKIKGFIQLLPLAVIGNQNLSFHSSSLHSQSFRSSLYKSKLSVYSIKRFRSLFSLVHRPLRSLLGTTLRNHDPAGAHRISAYSISTTASVIQFTIIRLSPIIPGHSVIASEDLQCLLEAPVTLTLISHPRRNRYRFKIFDPQTEEAVDRQVKATRVGRG